MRDEGDRFAAWRLDNAPTPTEADLGDEWVERALLAYAHRSAARVGAEWFAAEFARREEDERLQFQRAMEQRGTENGRAPHASIEGTLVDASVEDAVVGGAPTGLGLAPSPRLSAVDLQPTPQPVSVDIDVTPQPTDLEPEPAAPQPTSRHPNVPRPPASEPASAPKRRGRRRRHVETSTPSFVISAPEWARMSPGARRLYGIDAAPPPAAATG